MSQVEKQKKTSSCLPYLVANVQYHFALNSPYPLHLIECTSIRPIRCICCKISSVDKIRSRHVKEVDQLASVFRQPHQFSVSNMSQVEKQRKNLLLPYLVANVQYHFALDSHPLDLIECTSIRPVSYTHLTLPTKA